MYDEDELLPLSGIQHLLFCERRVALLHVEQQWADNLFTTEGSILHAKADGESPVETRGDVRIVRGLLLRSRMLGLSGRADVVEFRRVENLKAAVEDVLPSAVTLEGNVGFWRPFPVEFKRGRFRFELPYEAQLCAQAICLEEMLGVYVPSGAIFFGKSRRRRNVEFDEKLRRLTSQAANRLHEIVASVKTPVVEYSKKCESCSMRELCLPKFMKGALSVDAYLTKALDES